VQFVGFKVPKIARFSSFKRSELVGGGQGGLLVLKKHIVNGAWGKTEIIASRLPGPIYNPNLACNAITIHDCVSYEIEDMNWIEYGACLVSAPACYATLWASCTWEVCHNHMQYTNPIQ
jgi:hypothetical protein